MAAMGIPKKNFMELVNMDFIIAKTCPMCKETKNRDQYSESKSHKALRYECRSCASDRFNKWRYKDIEKRREKEREDRYVNKYGLSRDKAKSLVNDRVGTCEICKSITPLVVDHCHKKGHVRGLICTQCNSALGYSRDSIKVLKACIEYLEKDVGDE